MCSMSKYFQDKKNLNKERLQEMLTNLRKDKENKELYQGNIVDDGYRMMACCYSVAISDYCTFTYSGKHTCCSCGKSFGKDLKDAIEDCQLEHYKEYLKSDTNDVLFHGPYRPACFVNLLSNLENYASEVKSTFALNDLSLNIKYNPDIYSFEYCFDRKLTFEEWKSLNTNCHCDRKGYLYDNDSDTSPCFEYSELISSYESLVKQFKKLNVEAELKFNCSECCKKGKSELEFWIKFNDSKNYVISYPGKNVAYSDYCMVLKYLKGNNNYVDLIKNVYKDNQTVIDKLDIDVALNTIIGSNIFYNRAELKNMFYLYCSKKGFTDENKEKFAKFLELNSNVKVTPLIYKEFLDDLEDNGLLDEYLSEGDES